MRMADFKTILYKDWTGAHFEWRWSRQDHYLAARKFLETLLGGPASPVEGGDFFLLENEQQYDALIAFRRELERRERDSMD
jgi:hypothetical protein